MAKNKIQFQKGMSIPDFIKLYGTEDKCPAALFSLRWPNGFRCPRCDNKTYCEIKKKKSFNAAVVIFRHLSQQERYFIQPSCHLENGFLLCF